MSVYGFLLRKQLINNYIAVLSDCFFYAQKNIFEKKLKIISKNNQFSLVI